MTLLSLFNVLNECVQGVSAKSLWSLFNTEVYLLSCDPTLPRLMVMYVE